MAKNIDKLIIKYLTNSATISDLDTLSEWIEKPGNDIVFKEYVQTHVAIHYNMNDPETQKLIDSFLTAIQKDKASVYRLNISKVYKYAAAAAVILLMLALPFVLNKASYPEEVKEQPTVAETKIEPGTDKATLTLGDGSTIALEKGNTYQTKNINSNGEKLVYQATAGVKEMVYNYLTIPRGGQFQITLSDGTRVWLNSESQLKYPEAFISGETRQVELVYGEAYFDVSPSMEHNGDKFEVFNNSQAIEVVGTEFNVKAYKDETNIYTTLVEGRVSVNVPNVIDGQLLKPSEQLINNTKTNRLQVKEVDVYNEIAWKEGVFSFEDKTLKEITAVLSRWYDVDMIFMNKEIKDELFVGVLRKSQNLDEILEGIKNFKIINNYIIKDGIVIME